MSPFELTLMSKEVEQKVTCSVELRLPVPEVILDSGVTNKGCNLFPLAEPPPAAHRVRWEEGGVQRNLMEFNAKLFNPRKELISVGVSVKDKLIELMNNRKQRLHRTSATGEFIQTLNW